MMVPQQELICSLELECSRNFGSSKYSFYYPIQLDNFLVTCWKTSTASAGAMIGKNGTSNSFTSPLKSIDSSVHQQEPTSGGDRYCCTIYEDGYIIHPTIDKRMKSFPWAKSFSKKKDFSKEELEILLSDLYSANTLKK
ncbi:hypothetical protein PPL_02121 [Heterostelium album PN500]|uniref:Uncharacterized protein n=1 Tax=Heterostelium pallidum (strain ATCC 26659 / Pp 5 / PN500) TaxID=670386 RepID=D3B1E9_HETP5|nr:hypothetical protein PPL_02121 [Heterostelium album PN500]EFA85123.1 hypothetical protein PPL_02121 [Heterostelium album PN500]|eukprot:XP_020437232.1 hypothetical protein PPL_02121 [Heterostelium album PN500]